jgi:Leucine-rich repeat (LRR) protein
MPDFTGASNLEYLDMDGCTSLSTVHESIGAIAKLRFLSLRDYKILAGIPNSINAITSLVTLDLRGCLTLTTLPLGPNLSSSHMESLIFLDVSFCNLYHLPCAIGELRCLERLSLQGNNFYILPDTFLNLGRLSYLNLAHCHQLRAFPHIPTLKDLSLVGSYFKLVSGSRDHRSGLYVFDCPEVKFFLSNTEDYFSKYICQWLQRLLKVSISHNIPISLLL